MASPALRRRRYKHECGLDRPGRSGDLDGDDYLNIEEFRSGTDPNDPWSVTRLFALSTDGPEVFSVDRPRSGVIHTRSNTTKSWQESKGHR